MTTWAELAAAIGDALDGQDDEAVAAFTEAVATYTEPLRSGAGIEETITRIVAAHSASIAKRGEWSAREVRRLAVHEAGHAVAAFALGFPLREVTTEADLARTFDGVVRFRHRELEESGTDLAVLSYAGFEAERLAGFAFDPDPAARDYADAIAAVRSRFADLSEPEERALLVFCRTRATEVLRRHWPAVEALVTALASTPTLTGPEAEATIADALPRPMRALALEEAA